VLILVGHLGIKNYQIAGHPFDSGYRMSTLDENPRLKTYMVIGDLLCMFGFSKLKN